MGIVGLASAVIYLFSPQSLGLFGTASFFRYDVRYLAISFTLGSVAVAALSARFGPRVANAGRSCSARPSSHRSSTATSGRSTARSRRSSGSRRSARVRWRSGSRPGSWWSCC